MEYKLARLQDRCSRCDQEIADGAVCFSLVDLDVDEPLRRDFCAGCFGAVPHEGAIFWRTRKRSSGEPRRVVDFERLRDVFVRMVAHPADKHQELAYLMGLLLVRRRLFKLKDFTTENGRDVLVLVKPRSGDVYRVEAPLLNPRRLAALRDELSRLMDGEIDWEAGEPASSVESAGRSDEAGGESMDAAAEGSAEADATDRPAADSGGDGSRST